MLDRVYNNWIGHGSIVPGSLTPRRPERDARGVTVKGRQPELRGDSPMEPNDSSKPIGVCDSRSQHCSQLVNLDGHSQERE